MTLTTVYGRDANNRVNLFSASMFLLRSTVCGRRWLSCDFDLNVQTTKLH